MKHYFKFPTLLAMLALAVAFVSCGGDEPEDSFDTIAAMGGKPFAVAWTDGVARVSDLNASCTLKFNRLNRRVTIETTGVGALGSDNLTFTSLDYGLGDDGHSFALTQQGVKSDQGVTASIEMLYSGEKTINKVECMGIGLRMATPAADLTLMPRTVVWEGTTETTLVPQPDSTYVTTQTTYRVDIDPSTMKATMVVSLPKFAANMPSLGDMTFPDIDVEFVPGGFKLSKDSLTPILSDTPYPRYQITNLSATCNLIEPESVLEFNCMTVFKVYAKVGSNYSPE